jgi:hypothetical protein
MLLCFYLGRVEGLELGQAQVGQEQEEVAEEEHSDCVVFLLLCIQCAVCWVLGDN